MRTHNTASIAGYLLERLGIAGSAFVVSCACASTARAFGSTARMMAAGLCDAAIVGGADSLCCSVQNSMTSPEKNVIRRVGKLTLYERALGRYLDAQGSALSAVSRVEATSGLRLED
jgi:acetyl-CoA acetyltransferase